MAVDVVMFADVVPPEVAERVWENVSNKDRRHRTTIETFCFDLVCREQRSKPKQAVPGAYLTADIVHGESS